MPNFRVAFAEFPGQFVMNPKAAAYAHQAKEWLKRQPLVGQNGLLEFTRSSTPITMVRNHACKVALDRDCDLIIMLDSDMEPDYLVGHDKSVRPFLEVAFNFLFRSGGLPELPCCIAAPYCGPSPERTVMVGVSDSFDATGRVIVNADSARAALSTGIEQVIALATGLIVIDTRILKAMPPPWFAYEYTDRFDTHLKTTEDYYFTRNASLMGFPQYIAWDCWARHWKLEGVGKPLMVSADESLLKMRNLIRQGVCGEELKMLQLPDRLAKVVVNSSAQADLSTLAEPMCNRDAALNGLTKVASGGKAG